MTELDLAKKEISELSTQLYIEYKKVKELHSLKDYERTNRQI